MQSEKDITGNSNYRITGIFSGNLCAFSGGDRSIYLCEYPEHDHIVSTGSKGSDEMGRRGDKRDTELASMIQQGVDKITDTVETFFEDDIFFKGTDLSLQSITSGVIYGVKFVLNVIVGLIISVYVMADQEHFCRTGEKDRICDV